MASDNPGFTPDQAKDATQAQRQAAPPVGVDPGALAGRVASAAPAEVDVQALLARVQALEATLAAAGQSGEHPLIGTALTIEDQLRTHLTHGNLLNTPEGGSALRLAGDVVDAARNAVASGDVSIVRDLGGRLERALKRIHPGGGDHHYFRQALEFTRDHLPEAADLVTGPSPSGAAEIGSSQAPAAVVAGSVTG